MSLVVVAKRYAEALFEIGVETGTLPQVVEHTSAYAKACTDSADLRAVLHDPHVSERDREAILVEIGQRLGADQVVTDAMRLISRRKRMALLPAVARALSGMSDERAGLVRAHVVSARPLTEDFAARLQTELEKTCGKKVVLQREVDPSLIAGVVTRIGDTVIDGSVRTQLINLTSRLLSE